MSRELITPMHTLVQISNCYGLIGATIAWNQIINQPGNSRVEDNIDIYETSGTSSSPILIHDNYVDGAYNIDPTNALGGNWNYYGSGINAGEGDTNILSQAPAYVQAYNNIIVSTSGIGMIISSGNNISLTNNIIIFSGKLPNGNTIYESPNNGNLGVSIWNEYGQSSSVFFNNSGSGNTIGYVYPPGPGGRNDSWTPNVIFLDQ